MENILLIPRIATGAVLAVLAYSAIRKYLETKDKIFIEFAGMFFACTGWEVCGFAFSSASSSTIAMTGIRFSFTFGYLASIFFYRFAYRKYRNNLRNEWLQRFADVVNRASVFAIPILVTLSLPPWIVESVAFEEMAGNYGALYWPATLCAFSFSIIASVLLFLPKKLDSTEKLQHKYLRITMPLSAGLVFFSNVIIPNVIHTSRHSSLGTTSLAVAAGGLWYVIRRYRFLDLRYLFNRTVVVLGLCALALITFLGTYAALNTYGKPSWYNLTIISVLLTALCAALFTKKLRKLLTPFVDKRLLKISYDPKSIISKVTSLANTTLDGKKLKTQTLSLVKQELAIAKIHFVARRHKPVRELVVQKALSALSEPKLVRELSLDTKSVSALDRINENTKLIVPVNDHKTVFGWLLLGEKISEDSYTENDISALQSVAQQLAIGLDRARLYQKVQDFNVKLQGKIKSATAELNQKVRELQLARKREQEILNIMGHEIRTPATVAKGSVDFILSELKAGKAKQENLSKHLEMAKVGIDRQFNLAQKFLTAARMSKGIFVIDPEPTDLTELLRKTAKQFKPSATQLGIKFEAKLPKETIFADIDPQAIRQVLDNVLDNALKYTSDGKITLSAQRIGNKIEITITDTGIGIPQHELKELGKKYYRTSTAKKLPVSGTGIGLYVAFNIIKEHKGEIEIKSTEKKGTNVSITLEVAP